DHLADALPVGPHNLRADELVGPELILLERTALLGGDEQLLAPEPLGGVAVGSLLEGDEWEAVGGLERGHGEGGAVAQLDDLPRGEPGVGAVGEDFDDDCASQAVRPNDTAHDDAVS